MWAGRISARNITALTPKPAEYCIESDTQLTAGVPEGQFKLYKCKNNMWDVATPIMVGGQHVGNLFSGQFSFEEEELDYEFFRAQARRYGFDEEEYIALLESVPRLSNDFLHEGMALFMKLAALLSKLSYGNIKLARSLAQRDGLMDALQKSEAQLRTDCGESDGRRDCVGPERQLASLESHCVGDARI